ncbi:unnamed protein product [Schistosoma mattheei]|uniref:DUF7083 domain-containing protein n=1 Tax=Schistosoma mattheei TaxID=31246 RepID=A0AA85B1S1_9TREM|nr:unnamed protein product [Schistosoma mattheei]
MRIYSRCQYQMTNSTEYFINSKHKCGYWRLTNKPNIHCSSSHVISNTFCGAVAGSITDFIYDPESGNAFLTSFKRWKDTFRIEFCKQDDEWTTRLLMSKLGRNEHAHYGDQILPKLSRELSFEKTVTELSEIFDDSSSLFSIRYQCLNLVKHEADEYGALADVVNRVCTVLVMLIKRTIYMSNIHQSSSVTTRC